MKVLSIARKTLLELWREPLLMWLLLLFPALMVGFYDFAFARTEGGLATYLDVLVVNEDAGAELAEGGRWHAGEELVEALCAIEWEGEPLFDLQVLNDRRVAESALRERKASLLLTIPADFSADLVRLAADSGQTSPAVLSLVGDQGSDRYLFARVFLGGLLRQFAGQVTGWPEERLAIIHEAVPGTGTMSDFDYGVAGLIIFGITFVVFTAATVLVRENVAGTLQRLRLTRAGARELLLGVTLAQMVAAVAQILLTFGAAVALGFRSNGSLLLALGIGLLLNLSMVGIGLVVACFSRNDGDATNLASAVLVPLAFLSGAVFPMPELPLFSVASRTIQVYDLLPTAHAAEAMRRVLIFGEGLTAVAYELVMMAALAGIFLTVGVMLYRQLRMRNR